MSFSNTSFSTTSFNPTSFQFASAVGVVVLPLDLGGGHATVRKYTSIAPQQINLMAEDEEAIRMVMEAI